jgi:uncharacterized sulfatase
MAAGRKPNVIFFFTDQQRWDTCGCYGQPLPVTPNLDRMASEGVRFENAFTCQPVCGPARAVLQTGKFATQVGCETNHRILPRDQKTVAHWMSEAGYEVGYIGKWHLASFGEGGGPDDFRRSPVPLERRGGYKDYWLASDVLEFTSHSYDGHMFDGEGRKREFPQGRYRVDAQTDWAIEYLDSRSGEKPFFLFLSYIEPHHQNDHHCYEGPTGSKERWSDYPVPGDLEETGGDWRQNYPDYLGCINALDGALGRIRDRLDELGIWDNTLIIYTSDHGSHFCTRNGEYKRACHDGCTHIPLVIHGPGFHGGHVVEAMTSLVDLPPTILHTAGLDVPPYMQGRALHGAVAGTPSDWPEEVFIQISEDHNGRAIRTRRWTYEIRVPNEPPYEGGDVRENPVYVEYHLYDNEADPHQKNDLVADPAHAEVRTDLAERLKQWMARAGEPIPEIRPAG